MSAGSYCERFPTCPEFGEGRIPTCSKDDCPGKRVANAIAEMFSTKETSKSEWPMRGPDFNAWNRNVALFAQVVQENPGLWLIDSDLKYLNVRIDTRGGEFVLTCREGKHVTADRVVKAAREARNKGYNRVYADVSSKDESGSVIALNEPKQ